MKNWEWRKERRRAVVNSFLLTAIVIADTYYTQTANCPSPVFASMGALFDWFIIAWLLSTFVLYYIKRLLFHLFSI